MRERTVPKWVARLFTVIGLTVFAGCGPSRTDVAGKVSYRGRPVVYGTVSVIGSDQITYYGAIQTDGSFAVRHVPVGAVRIGVYSPDPYFELPVPPNVKKQIEAARRAQGVEELPKPLKGQWFKIPPKYADPLTSSLTAQVEGPSPIIECSLD
ncbi:peptidase associated/transthyretin-like domain-containing protein [Limnoglobus roseus]|uniref:Carboxypeptidase regulatory-like domain-containing protein n=1 Tax=Limnoglobus roseus TaxID=2598579 RepID=A0A5C1ABN7_9BACT|nr:hypothetical protein [Limnoglobus roseus]QEL15583.1 carboxypeptidase regulatory-like domain-containing protein [Limnoglobus roseus]